MSLGWNAVRDRESLSWRLYLIAFIDFVCVRVWCVRHVHTQVRWTFFLFGGGEGAVAGGL